MDRRIRNRLAYMAALLLYIGSLAGCREQGSAVVIQAQESQETTDMAAETTKADADTEVGMQQETVSAEMIVHVAGQVQNPGVYRLPEGSRVWDAVQAAGGFSEEAAADAVNLASVVEDGCKITIPSIEDMLEAETEPVYGISSGDRGDGGNPTDQSFGLIDLNTATKEQLMTIPGIGETRAEAILSYRQQQGKFRAIEDIMNVTGIKEGLFSKIREYITVGG